MKDFYLEKYTRNIINVFDIENHKDQTHSRRRGGEVVVVLLGAQCIK